MSGSSCMAPILISMPRAMLSPYSTRVQRSRFIVPLAAMRACRSPMSSVREASALQCITAPAEPEAAIDRLRAASAPPSGRFRRRGRSRFRT